jgi:hypothetical protein
MVNVEFSALSAPKTLFTTASRLLYSTKSFMGY